VAEVAKSAEDHGEAEAVGGGDDFGVFDGTAGLDGGGDAVLGGGFEAIGEGEEGVGGDDESRREAGRTFWRRFRRRRRGSFVRRRR
jgi:hypothetical protein